MSNDFGFTDNEQAEWDAFVKEFRENTLRHMDSSALVMSFVPPGGEFDVKHALELGACIMLDKPILIVALQESDVPPKLRAIADEIVISDVDTEGGRERVMAAVERLQKQP